MSSGMQVERGLDPAKREAFEYVHQVVAVAREPGLRCEWGRQAREELSSSMASLREAAPRTLPPWSAFVPCVGV